MSGAGTPLGRANAIIQSPRIRRSLSLIRFMADASIPPRRSGAPRGPAPRLAARCPAAPPPLVGQGSMVHVGHTPTLVYFVSVETVHASRLALNKACLRGAAPSCRQPVTRHRNFHAEFLRQNAPEMKDFAFSRPKTDNVAEVYPRNPLNRWAEGQVLGGGEEEEDKTRRKTSSSVKVIS